MWETLAPTMARWLAVSVVLRLSRGCSRELMPVPFPVLPGSSGSSTQSSCLHSGSGAVVGSPASPGLCSPAMAAAGTELSGLPLFRTRENGM
uniref:Secreted protein n=1 Tax=Arundo donax TaxID=35708 RepID=A0A0A9DQT6_ARUDO